MSEIQPPPITVQQQKTSASAIASMVLGILSVLGLVFLIFPPILAVVFGHVSLSTIRKDPSQSGRGMAIAGLVMGYISIVPVLLLGLMAALAVPAMQKVRVQSQELAITNNARVISSSAEQYFLENGVSEVSLEVLYEGQYLTEILPVADEVYPSVIRSGEQIVVERVDAESIVLDLDEF